MFNALIPIFALILLGYALKRLHFPAGAFWPEAERITYYLFLPALIVHNLAEADFSRLAAAPMAAPWPWASWRPAACSWRRGPSWASPARPSPRCSRAGCA
jgi:hypothetical protein